MVLRFTLVLLLAMATASLYAQCTMANFTSVTAIGAGNFPYNSVSSGVTVNAVLSGVPTLGNTGYTCNGTMFNTAANAWWPNTSTGTITLTFSCAISNFTVVINGTNTGEIFTFTPNAGSVTLSNYCAVDYAPVLPNQLIYNGSPASGTIITINNPVGATQYVLRHNGVGSGSRMSLLDCFVCATVLPAELEVFDAEYLAASKDVDLRWEAVDAAGGFEVEHSVDGNVWNKIGFVDSRVDGEGKAGYDFLHGQPADGANYYRLKLMDGDGNFTLSETREVFVASVLVGATIFPNPNNGVFEVVASGRTGDLTVVDALGRVVARHAFDGSLQLDLSRFEKGVYQVEIVDGQHLRSVQKVVVQ